MFDLMVFVLINAFWFTLIIGTLTLLILRIVYTYTNTYTMKQRLYIWFMPLSIGFYQFEKQKNLISKVYRRLVILFFITGFLAFLYIVYTELELMLI